MRQSPPRRGGVIRQLWWGWCGAVRGRGSGRQCHLWSPQKQKAHPPWTPTPEMDQWTRPQRTGTPKPTPGNLQGMSAPYDDRTAKWLVGDRLSSVLHLGNHPLVNQLADQGHDVVVATDRLARTEHHEVSYVLTAGDRLPFAGSVFDVVIAPDVRRSPSELADIARVLKADGLLSTISQTYDDSIPWLRKLRELVGDPTPQVSTVDTFTASGLFELPEISDFGSWEKLDMDALMAFAESTMVGAETGDTMT